MRGDARSAKRSGVRMTSLGIAFLAFARLTAAQQHVTFQNGDIIAGGQTLSQIEAFGRFDWFLPEGTLNKRIAEPLDEFPSDFAFDAAGNLYSPTFFTVRIFDSSGRFLRNFPRFAANWFNAIVFDRFGNAYVSGSFAGGTLAKVDSAGNLLRTFKLPFVSSSAGVGVFDLSADQCTILYGSGDRILRYDVCNAAPLTDFASLPRPGQVRILSDGGVLVASLDAIHRLSDTGQILQTYRVAGQLFWSGFALDSAGGSFWAISGNTAFKLDMSSGAVLASFKSSDYLFDAVAVVGEPRAALAAPASIPTLSQWLFFALAIALGGVGVIRLALPP